VAYLFGLLVLVSLIANRGASELVVHQRDVSADFQQYRIERMLDLVGPADVVNESRLVKGRAIGELVSHATYHDRKNETSALRRRDGHADINLLGAQKFGNDRCNELIRKDGRAIGRQERLGAVLRITDGVAPALEITEFALLREGHSVVVRLVGFCQGDIAIEMDGSCNGAADVLDSYSEDCGAVKHERRFGDHINRQPRPICDFELFLRNAVGFDRQVQGGFRLLPLGDEKYHAGHSRYGYEPVKYQAEHIGPAPNVRVTRDWPYILLGAIALGCGLGLSCLGWYWLVSGSIWRCVFYQIGMIVCVLVSLNLIFHRKSSEESLVGVVVLNGEAAGIRNKGPVRLNGVSLSEYVFVRKFDNEAKRIPVPWRADGRYKRMIEPFLQSREGGRRLRLSGQHDWRWELVRLLLLPISNLQIHRGYGEVQGAGRSKILQRKFDHRVDGWSPNVVPAAVEHPITLDQDVRALGEHNGVPLVSERPIGDHSSSDGDRRHDPVRPRWRTIAQPVPLFIFGVIAIGGGYLFAYRLQFVRERPDVAFVLLAAYGCGIVGLIALIGWLSEGA
jgi:hypothetical protein